MINNKRAWRAQRKGCHMTEPCYRFENGALYVPREQRQRPDQNTHISGRGGALSGPDAALRPPGRGHPPTATQLEAQPYSVVRRSPDATLEDFKDRASFASARYRQPGATRSLDMLSGQPPEIIR